MSFLLGVFSQVFEYFMNICIVWTWLIKPFQCKFVFCKNQNALFTLLFLNSCWNIFICNCFQMLKQNLSTDALKEIKVDSTAHVRDNIIIISHFSINIFWLYSVSLPPNSDVITQTQLSLSRCTHSMFFLCAVAGVHNLTWHMRFSTAFSK